jgi:hypothetical protein
VVDDHFVCFSSHLTWWCNRLDGRALLSSIGNCQIGEVCKTASIQGPKRSLEHDMSPMPQSRHSNKCTDNPSGLSSNTRIVFQATLHKHLRHFSSFHPPSDTLSKHVDEVFVLQIRHIVKSLVSNPTSSFPIIDHPTLLLTGKLRRLGHRQVHHIC